MKLLLDENLLRRLATFLLATFPGSSQIALLGLEQRMTGRFGIATKDTAFYELSALYGQPPKIIWLKIGEQQGCND